VAVYGVLKAGAAYVPLDPQSPVARLAYIARNAELSVLVTGLEKVDAWEPLVREGAPLRTLVALNASDAELDGAPAGMRALGRGALADLPTTPPAGRGADSELAYILYTSGSTGDPKGVMLSHRNALTFVDWAAAEFALAPTDRLSSHAPLHFDLSTFDLFGAARAGAAVVLVPAGLSVFPIEVARWIGEREITVWYSVPSALSALLLRGKLEVGQFPCLRRVLFAGEVFPTKYLASLMELLPHVRFHNLYGPTETNVCTWYDVPPQGAPDPIPIGRPIAGVEAFAVDDEGRRADSGELCVRGPSVMQGYWGDREATARALGPLPAAGVEDEPVYRTGDLVSLAEDGNFLFLGRRDAQVKRRGYRIELGEIETALHAHEGVVECAVTSAASELGETRITAHVVVRDGVGEPELVAACAERIPSYALPDEFRFHSALPQTSTGKTDRRALGG
jgi:amino acid adenylation domain-containing protein